MHTNFLYLLFSLFSFSTIILADTECPNVVSFGEDRRTNKNSLRLVQFNVEWLFVDYYSPMNCPGDGCTWKNQSEAEIHMNYIAKTINNLDADIINLCEVEGCDELNELNEQLDGTHNVYLKKGTDSSTGQNVGMLTRIDPLMSLYRSEVKYNYPISGSNCGYNGTGGSSGVSKHFITEFEFSGMNVAFISAHLLAIPTDSARCAQREAQAAVLQSVISDYIQRDYEIIMIGDFNDYDSEVLDVNNNKPISRVLDILKGNIPIYSEGYTLYSIAETIPQSERYSDWWDSDNNCNTSSDSDYSMIDHVLVTDSIRKNIINTFVYHGYNEYCGKYDSDHFPVVVDLVM
jgi:exonuclease III